MSKEGMTEREKMQALMHRADDLIELAEHIIKILDRSEDEKDHS